MVGGAISYDHFKPATITLGPSTPTCFRDPILDTRVHEAIHRRQMREELSLGQLASALRHTTDYLVASVLRKQRYGQKATAHWRLWDPAFCRGVATREHVSEDRRCATALAGRAVGGKSELRRAGCRVTPGRRKATESAAESRPPMASLHRGAQARVKGCGKSAPGVR